VIARLRDLRADLERVEVDKTEVPLMISIQRYSIFFIASAFVLAGCSGGATNDPATSSAQALSDAGAPQVPSLSSSAATASKVWSGAAQATSSMTSAALAPKDWRRAVSKMPLPKEGCFQVTHPNTTWVEVPCTTPPAVPYLPAKGGGTPESVGNTADYAPQVSGTISWAEGSFPSVTGVMSESDGTSNNYSLQLNSNHITTTSLCGHIQGCTGWQQFTYSSGGPSICGSGVPCAFIQYWLLGYGTICNSGWNSDGEGNCWQNSTNGVPVPAEPITDLANLAMIGTAGSVDSVAMTVAGTVYAMSQASVLNLNTGWTIAEFNVFGNTKKTQAVFNPGSTIVVQTLTDSVTPTTNAPACVNFSGTGETNNLTLVANSCCRMAGSLPGIQFEESNATSPTVQTCAIDPVDADWSSVGHPFDGLLVGLDSDGTPLSSCRAKYQSGLQPGKTRPDWAYCDIGFNGAEVAVAPYETLVAAWTDETNGAVPTNAFAFGTDGSGGSALYPCRAYVNGSGYELGKVRPGIGACYIPYNGQELQETRYQVLTSTLPWVAGSVSSAPPGALVGGYDSNDAPLYVCQAQYGGGFVPGKTRTDWNYCDVSFSGQEHHVTSFNVLFAQFKSSPGTIVDAGYESNGSVLGVCRLQGANAQVGKYLSSGACNFGYGGQEVSDTSGYQVLSF
jgi:hypothetical protein